MEHHAKKAQVTASSPAARALLALAEDLDKSQWYRPSELTARQDSLLMALAAHAAEHSDHFAGRLKAAGLTPAALATPEGFARLPIISKRDLQDAGQTLFSREIPADHGPAFTTKSSGSTGEPVVIKRTTVSQLDWMATTMRDHHWHERDFTGRLCAVRAQSKGPTTGADWGAPVNLLYPSAPALALPAAMPIGELAKHIARFAPSYLVVYPSILEGLIGHLKAQDLEFSGLREIRLIGETFSQPARDNAAAFFKVKLTDLYSSQEVGNIALQCPESGLYHVMAENIRVEILDADDRACNPGEIGRVVVTDLRNFATPLMRYDLGDYAETAAPCPCGRGLPTLARIAGRARNLVVLPNGKRHWPQVGYGEYRKIAPIRQFQLIQQDLHSIEVRLVADAAVSVEQEAALTAVIRRKLGYPFALRFVYFSGRLPTGPGGKFEEFVCQA